MNSLYSASPASITVMVAPPLFAVPLTLVIKLVVKRVGGQVTKLDDDESVTSVGTTT
ncbi:hypothetical protein D3C71_1821810 [compost metagenome]